MLQPLNFFAPYADLPGRHENQLTRALLVVLRYSPMAHAAWLNLVDPSLRLEELPNAVLRTQNARALSIQDQESEEPTRGIPVFLTPDAGEVATPVKPSSRTQILDAIVEYCQDLVVVVENKISFGVVTGQPNAINTYGANVRFDAEVQVVSWQRLLSVYAYIAARGLSSGAEYTSQVCQHAVHQLIRQTRSVHDS